VIEAVRLAEALAALRDRAMPGLEELHEATRAVLTHGSDAQLALIRERLEIGRGLGRVPPDAPMVPLAQDVAAQQKTLRLKVSAEAKVLDLDLRNDTDRARSRLLHRLRLLDVEWGSTEEVQSAGTFKERWTLQWDPELALALVEASVHGNTVEVAAGARGRRAGAAHRRSGRADGAAPPRGAGRAGRRGGRGAGPRLGGVGPGRRRARADEGPAAAGPRGPLGYRARHRARAPLAGARRAFRARGGGPAGRLHLARSRRRPRRAHPARRRDRRAAGCSTGRSRCSSGTRSCSRCWGRTWCTPWCAGPARACCSRPGTWRRRSWPATRSWRCRRRWSRPAPRPGPRGVLGQSATLPLAHEGLWRALDRWLLGLDETVFLELLPLVRRAFAGVDAPARRVLGERVRALGDTDGPRVPIARRVVLDESRVELLGPLLRQVVGLDGPAEERAS
jgi:hypothetical protein